ALAAAHPHSASLPERTHASRSYPLVSSSTIAPSRAKPASTARTHLAAAAALARLAGGGGAHPARPGQAPEEATKLGAPLREWEPPRGRRRVRRLGPRVRRRARGRLRPVPRIALTPLRAAPATWPGRSAAFGLSAANLPLFKT